MSERKIVIVPCSGIGKTYGTVTREAAYDLTEDMRPDETQLVALSMLVLGEEGARAAVGSGPAITIDGCKLACATKMVRDSGGTVAKDYAVLDAYRHHKAFKPAGIAELNEGGIQLAHALAEEIASEIDRIMNEETTDYPDDEDLKQGTHVGLEPPAFANPDGPLEKELSSQSVISVQPVVSPPEVNHA